MSSSGSRDASTSKQHEGGADTVSTQASAIDEGQQRGSGSQTKEKASSRGETREQFSISESDTSGATPAFSGALSSSTADDLKARQQIDSLVESFQNGRVPKSETLYRILSIISRTSYPSAIKTQSSHEYMQLFDDIDRQRELREKRGTNDVPGES
ncbi:hypothetical protein H0H93_014133, partial [Arthromyces matolae]